MVAVNIRTDAFDVRIDRKTKWGNRFVMQSEADRSQVIEDHRRALWADIRAGRITLEDLAGLDGKRLGCHCAPKPCHGDTLTAAAAWAAQKLRERQSTSA